MNSKFDPHYLAYLAETGATGLHAFRGDGTAQLRSALDLRPGHRVLEVGCGTGQTMLSFSRDYRVVVDGLDFLAPMLRVARTRLRWSGCASRTNLIQADTSVAIPLKGDTYDAVFTESVLGIQSADRVRTALTEACRVLKPGGRFVANEGVWKLGTPPELAARIAASCARDFGFPPVSGDCWSYLDWITNIEQAGLKVIQADLLGEVCGERMHGTRMSGLVTCFFRARAYLSPRMLQLRRQYRTLLEMHRSDHESIEARLFVAIKPRFL